VNGDGLTDIVRVRSSDIRYWPGRGDGTFGTGPLGCAGDTQSENSYVLMAESPDYSAPSASMVQLNDVNGDGTSDLVQIRTDEVDVWFNVDGTSWQQRRIITGTPDSSNYGKRVRLTDMNGSGTADIVWAVGLGYKYIDLSAGRRPRPEQGWLRLGGPGPHRLRPQGRGTSQVLGLGVQ
jgi:VCBS repeat protein